MYARNKYVKNNSNEKINKSENMLLGELINEEGKELHIRDIPKSEIV